MAIDIQSLFNPGSLQQMAETEDEKKKRAQITGTMNFGAQTGTFNGNFDPSLLQQQNTSAPMGYQPPPNYGMSAPPEQPPVPVIQPPALPPPVGSNPISGEYNIPDQQPVPLPPGNQPYVSPPSPLPPWVNETTTMANPLSQIPVGEQYNTYADYSQLPPSAQPPAPVQPPVFERGPNYDGKDFGPSDLYGMPQPVQQPLARDPMYAGMPDDMYNNMMEHRNRVGEFGLDQPVERPWDRWMYDQRNPPAPKTQEQINAEVGEWRRSMGMPDLPPEPDPSQYQSGILPIAPGGMGLGR